MDSRLSLITLGVADLDRSRAFYERLGARRKVADTQGIVFFQMGGMGLALYPRAELAADAQVPPSESGGFPGFTLAYIARDREEVDRVLAEAVAAGATLRKPALDVFWGGYSGYFADPDGFLWEVAWNPFVTLTEDGAVILPD